MTSPARGGPDTAGTAREQVARWLSGKIDRPFMWDRSDDAYRAMWLAEADELLSLPVVQLLAVEKAAEELRAAAVCPTPCDEDCDADCHEAHTPSWKRLHQPEHCPSRLFAAAAQPGDGRTGE